MRILIAYGSTEGQTRKIVQAMSSQIGGLGHDVESFDTSGIPRDLHVEAFDRIIVAGSVHERRHQKSVEVFALAHSEVLRAKPTMFVSVSLAAAFEDSLADARGYVDSFFREVGWQPGQTLLVAGALHHGEYDYFSEQILEHIVLKDKDVAHPEEDREFTDWQALAKATEAFVRA
jgi:menaquinone-dependent protoporphyrinogen oxidase